MIELENIRGQVADIFDGDSWIKFVHEGLLPAYTSGEKAKNVVLAAISNHCSICRNINGCCFPKNNMPEYPLHPNCHCFLVDIAKPQVKAECQEEKFTDYIFNPKYEFLGKKALFESWGYDTINVQYLVDEIIRQAEENYARGNFKLGLLNKYGQRISIIIELDRKDEKGIVKFLSGWMVYPNGNIKLTTPYGGTVK
ncbi:MAG: hypothetical protein K2O95_00650 [Clostridia bacterium]|nr:hypothetical protein [Clostridia bacterium]MDE7078608.1 hypothetical protein [Clostridia bacterium]